MIFGIVGAHCTGKTTFVRSFREAYPDLPNVGYVHGDLTTDNYTLVPPRYRESHYFRQMKSKKSMILDFIQDRDKLWIIEGCRFWGGMFHHVAPTVEKLRGGLFMVVVVTSPVLMLKLMKQRAIDNRRTLKLDYWDDSKLEYEARRRHINTVSKSLREQDWTTVEFLGDFDMWNGDPLYLLKAFVADKSLWYRKFPAIIERTPV